MTDQQHASRQAEWDSLRRQYLRSDRPASTARGVHHIALMCSDVARTIDFYQGLLEFPLTELFENRDFEGSTHFFFDIGNGNSLAFFDFPGLGLEAYREVLGGLHHIAISVEPVTWDRLRIKLENASVETVVMGGSSMYLTGPDSERIELISDPLGEMHGNAIG